MGLCSLFGRSNSSRTPLAQAAYKAPSNVGLMASLMDKKSVISHIGIDKSREGLLPEKMVCLRMQT